MKKQIIPKVVIFAIWILGASPLGWTQQSGEPPKVIMSAPAAFGRIGMAGEEIGPVAGVRVMNGMSGDDVVKGVPFSGTLRTESTRTFADGNRIHQENSSKIWRDREGRIRTEAQLMLPPGLTTEAPPTLVSISDPIAKVRYVLEPERKIARKLPFAPELLMRKMTSEGAALGPGVMQIAVAAPEGMEEAGHKDVMFYSRAKPMERPATEDLGERDFDGVRATGARLTTTIPAGEVNNERAIEIVSENWYSKTLKTTVMTKHSDPWAGEFTSHLTEVSTSDPDPALFTVPAGYRVVEEKFPPEMLISPASSK